MGRKLTSWSLGLKVFSVLIILRDNEATHDTRGSQVFFPKGAHSTT